MKGFQRLLVALLYAVLQLVPLHLALPHPQEKPTHLEAGPSREPREHVELPPLPDVQVVATPIPGTNPQLFHINLPPQARDPQVWEEARQQAVESNRIRAIAVEIYAALVTNENRREASHQLGFADEREIRALVNAREEDRASIAERIRVDYEENYS